MDLPLLGEYERQHGPLWYGDVTQPQGYRLPEEDYQLSGLLRALRYAASEGAGGGRYPMMLPPTHPPVSPLVQYTPTGQPMIRSRGPQMGEQGPGREPPPLPEPQLTPRQRKAAIREAAHTTPIVRPSKPRTFKIRKATAEEGETDKGYALYKKLSTAPLAPNEMGRRVIYDPTGRGGYEITPPRIGPTERKRSRQWYRQRLNEAIQREYMRLKAEQETEGQEEPIEE